MSASLIAKGKDQGFLLSDEIMAAFPQPEADVSGLDEFYSSLLELGIEVVALLVPGRPLRGPTGPATSPEQSHWSQPSAGVSTACPPVDP